MSDETKVWHRQIAAETKAAQESRDFWQRVKATKAERANDVTNALLDDAWAAWYSEFYSPPPNPMRLAVKRAVSNWR